MSKIKLLLVDDEEDYVRTLAERLCIREMECRVALDGEQAMAMLEEETPDVMVVDLRMPGMGGLKVLERVKKRHPQVQVIIFTGHGSRSEQEEARRIGASAYLQKPADVQRLMEIIRKFRPVSPAP